MEKEGEQNLNGVQRRLRGATCDSQEKVQTTEGSGNLKCARARGVLVISSANETHLILRTNPLAFPSFHFPKGSAKLIINRYLKFSFNLHSYPFT